MIEKSIFLEHIKDNLFGGNFVNMKKGYFIFIIALVFGGMVGGSISAYADGELSYELFDRAKQAIVLASYGEYSEALNEIAIEENLESFETFVCDKLASIFNGAVQTEVGLGWKDGDGWHIAIPIQTPNDDDVEVFVLHSVDGATFDGYAALTWGKVIKKADAADQKVWKEAQEAEVSIVVPD